MTEYTRDSLRDLIMGEAEIPGTVKALGLFYVNTISDADVEMINRVAPVIIEKLKTGEMEDIITILEDQGVPAPLLALLKIQVELYGKKISQHQT